MLPATHRPPHATMVQRRLSRFVDVSASPFAFVSLYCPLIDWAVHCGPSGERSSTAFDRFFNSDAPQVPLVSIKTIRGEASDGHPVRSFVL